MRSLPNDKILPLLLHTSCDKRSLFQSTMIWLPYFKQKARQYLKHVFVVFSYCTSIGGSSWYFFGTVLILDRVPKVCTFFTWGSNIFLFSLHCSTTPPPNQFPYHFLSPPEEWVQCVRFVLLWKETPSSDSTFLLLSIKQASKQTNNNLETYGTRTWIHSNIYIIYTFHPYNPVESCRKIQSWWLSKTYLNAYYSQLLLLSF